MAYKSRLTHLLIVAGLVVASLYSYDSVRSGLWANVAVGIGLFIALFVLVVTSTPVNQISDTQMPETGAAGAYGLHTLLDQMPTPAVSYTAGEAPKAVNRAARALFRTDDAIVSDAVPVSEAMSASYSSARPILTVNGRRYAVSVSEIISDSGAIRLGILTDVQMEIHKAEAAALRDTLQILSHEIMNSLTPVASLADIADSYLAEESSDAVRSAREALEMLSRRATNLTTFIEAYRSIARLPEPILKLVDPVRLAQDAMNVFVHGLAVASVEFDLAFDDDLPQLALDEPQVSQALINVLTNAVEATSESDTRRVSVKVERAQHDVLVKVSDSGPGISESVKSDLFTAFATTKTKGTGTGLNLARQIALAHGGNLQLTADGQNEATTFVFSFPVSPIR